MMSLMQGVSGRYRACHVINLRSDLIGMYIPEAIEGIEVVM